VKRGLMEDLLTGKRRVSVGVNPLRRQFIVALSIKFSGHALLKDTNIKGTWISSG